VARGISPGLFFFLQQSYNDGSTTLPPEEYSFKIVRKVVNTMAATAKVGLTIKLDGKEFTVNENDVVNGLQYTENGQTKTIDGRIRVICATTKAQNIDPPTCPPDPYLQNYITPTKVIVDYSEENVAKITRINISNITGIGSVVDAETADGVVAVGPGTGFKALNDVLADADPGSIVKLQAGEYGGDDPLLITKDVTLIGEPGATITCPIQISGPEAAPAVEGGEPEPFDPVSVEISGLILTGKATIVVGENVDKFVMTDCVFENHDLTAKTMPILIGNPSKKDLMPLFLDISDNTFGDEGSFAYNTIEVYSPLVDGSHISNNTFTKSNCTHNQINLYGIDNGATVSIDGNHAEMSANMVRIGFKGTPVGTVVMDGNSYDETGDTPEWQGLFLVQPFSKATESFAGVTIHINNTTYPKGTQLGYIYAGSADTPWTTDNKPTFYVDGVKTEVPCAN